MATPVVTPKPKPAPIKGAVEPFNTTGYPTPPSAPGKVVPMAKAPHAMAACLEIYPSQAQLEFSIGDLQLLGKVTDIGHLVFEVSFVDPKEAELREFTIEISSPERKKLYTITLHPGCGIKAGPQPKYALSLNEDDAERAERFFTPGNRLIVHAKVAEEIKKGKIAVAVRECD
jgi:hypothetical protein